MGPRPSISGEIPIDSYFISSSKTAGIIGNKENTRSLKRRTGADADDPNPSSTKKQRTKQPSEGTDLDNQGKSHSEAVKARRKPVPNASGTTTAIPTPISVAKRSRSTSSRVPADIEVITVNSSSPLRATHFDTGDVARPEKNIASGSGLPTPQTVCHKGKKDSQTDHHVPAASLPTGPTVSRFVIESRPAIPSLVLRPPLTPSRSKTKPDHIAVAYRTTPHSQRIVPSSQWSDDDQPGTELASSLEENRGHFSHRREEPDYCPNELALPPPPDVISRPFSTSSLTPVKRRTPTLVTFAEPSKEYSKTNLYASDVGYMKTGPLFLSSSPRTVSSSCSVLVDRGQNSQIVPTSQFDEIELKVPTQSPPVTCPTLPPHTNRRKMTPSVERSQTGSPSLQDRSSHSEAILEQNPSSKDYCYRLQEPPSPLTPLSPSSPQLSDVMNREMNAIGTDRSPLQRTSHGTPKSPVPCSSLESIAELGSGGIVQLLPEVDVPAEDRTSASDEDKELLVHPSPVHRQPPCANDKDTISQAGEGPSASTYSHLRISHAKLRSIPDPTVELDSDGEEMSSDGSFSIPAMSQGMSMSSTSSYLDLIGTLPSAVEDFLDMVDSDTFSNV